VVRVTLIVVSGAPGTGKSTVAAALAGELRWPLLALDMIKETLADVLGLGDERWSDVLGDAAAEVVFRLSVRFPDAIAEGWWRGTRRARAARQFAGAAEVFCYCDPGLVTARMRGRHGKERHPIHRDVINPSSMLLGHVEMLAGVVSTLGLGGTLVKVDTGQPDAAAAAVAAVTAALC
jgi:predicted kinase